MNISKLEKRSAVRFVRPNRIRAGFIATAFAATLVGQFFAACSSESGAPGETVTRTLTVTSPANFYLGSASTFSVISGPAGMTNIGVNTKINGDVATVAFATSVTGFHDPLTIFTETPLNIGTVSGKVYTKTVAADYPIAYAAYSDAQALYLKLAAVPGGQNIGAQLGGMTLEPGVYKSAAAYDITTGNLTLDAKGDPDATWIFQMGSSLTVGAVGQPRSIVLVNGAQAKNVFWQVGSAATINYGGGGYMVGTVISQAGSTIGTANTQNTLFNGRIIALYASVTMENTIFNDATLITDALVVSNSRISLSGTNQANITATVTGIGYIVAANNGTGFLTATVTGSGTLNASNAAGSVGALTATLTGPGLLTVVNNGTTGAVTVTNTGNGDMSVTNSGSAALTVSNTSDASITLTSSGAVANTYTWAIGDGMSPSVVCAGGTCTATP